MNYKIVLKPNGGLYKIACYTCGERFRLEEVAIKIYDEEGHCEFICGSCLKAGPNAGMRDRVREYVKSLKELVTELEKLAEAPPIDSPTWETYKETYEKRIREIMDEEKRAYEQFIGEQ